MAWRWVLAALGLLCLAACERTRVPRQGSVSASRAGTDGRGQSGAGEPAADDEVICEGDFWGSEQQMIDEVMGCTVVTGDLTLTSNDLLSVDMPLLRRVDGSLSASLNPALARVAMRKLERVGGSVSFSNDDVLTSLELPSLEQVNANGEDNIFDLAIRQNPLLPNCLAEVVHERLREHGFHGIVDISGNDGSCPQ